MSSQSNREHPVAEAIQAFARTRERLDRLSGAAAVARPLAAAARANGMVGRAVMGAERVAGVTAATRSAAATQLARADRILGDAPRIARRAAAALEPARGAPSAAAIAMLGRRQGAAGTREARAGSTPHGVVARALAGLGRAAARLEAAGAATDSGVGADAARATRAASAPVPGTAAMLNPMLRAARAADAAVAGNRAGAARVPDELIAPARRERLALSAPPLDFGARLGGVLARFARGAGGSGESTLSAPPRSAGPVTINFSPNIKVEVAGGGPAAPGQDEIGRAVARALEKHAEELHNLVLRVAVGRDRTDY